MYLEQFQSENRHEVKKKIDELIKGKRLKNCMYLDIYYSPSLACGFFGPKSSSTTKTSYQITCWKGSFKEDEDNICPIDCSYYKHARWKWFCNGFNKYKYFITNFWKWFAGASTKVQVLVLTIFLLIITAIILKIFPNESKIILRYVEKWILK